MAFGTIFGVIGGGIGGPIGGALGAAAGSYLDQRYFIPGFFPPDDQVGPRVIDLRTSSQNEGASFARCFGRNVRVPGVLLWASPLIENIDSHNQGKGAGSGGNFLTYTYAVFADVAFASRGGSQLQALLDQGVRQLYADGKKIWDYAPDIDLPALVINLFDEYVVTPPGGIIPTYYMVIESDVGGYDLNQFVKGKELTLGGLTGTYAVDNGISKVFSTSYGSGPDIGKTYLTMRRKPPENQYVVAGGTAQTVSLFQSIPRFNPSQMSDDPTACSGTETQLPDTTEEGYQGVGNVPGYRDLARRVFDKLKLQDFGNRIPNFEALVGADDSLTVGECIMQICQERGVATSLINADLCTEDLEGYSTIGPTSGITALQPLMMFFDIVAQMRGEVLHFFPRALAPVVVIDPADLGTVESGGSEEPRTVLISDADLQGLPTELQLLFQDPQRHYQTGGVTSRIANREERVPVTVNFETLVAPSGRARKAAEVILRREHQGSRRLTFTVPIEPYGATLRESCIASFPADGEDWLIFIEKIDIGENGLMRCEGVDEDPRHAVQFSTSEDGTGPQDLIAAGGQGTSFDTGLVAFEVVDNFVLRDEDARNATIYAGACQSQFGATFKGASLQMSADEGGTDIDGNTTEEGKVYNEIARLTFAATIGHTETALADVSLTTTSSFLDITSVLDVKLYNGTFESVTPLQCDRGSNRLVVGNELIGFETAEYLGDNRWRLTNIQRGLQGSDVEIASHVSHERCILISGPGIIAIPINQAAVGSTRSFKCIGAGSRVEDVEPTDIELLGATVRPITPVNVIAVRDGGNNVSITMARRTRGIFNPWAGLPLPHYERRTAFTLELLGTPGPGLSTTKTVETDDDTFTFAGASGISAAEQTTAGYTPGDPLNVRIYREADILGRGRILETVI